MPEYRIKPGGMHEKFFNSRNKIQIIGGGFGNGKTAASCIKGIQLAKDYPGSNGIIAMATYAQLNDTIREEFYKWIPSSAVKRWPTISDNTMILKNGSRINFRYLQQKGKQTADGQTSSNLLSATYDWAIVDQIENPAITHKDFLDLLGRMRGSTPYKGRDKTMPQTGPRWVILTANPAFNWVFHKLIKPMTIYRETGEITSELIVDKNNKPLIDLFEAPTYENKHNLEKDFIDTLEAAYTGQFRDRYLGGEWGAFEGLIYPSFNAGTHLVDKGLMIKYLMKLNYSGIKPQVFHCFDFGIASPSCYLFGFIDDLGRVFIIDGFYEKEMDLTAIGLEIVRIQHQYDSFIDVDHPIMADPAIFKRTVFKRSGASSTTVARVLMDEAELMLKRGQNDIKNGIAKVSSYLSIDSLPSPFYPDKTGPAIYFAKHLNFIVDEFGSYFWKMNGSNERIDEPIDRNDHAMDALKYGFSTLPPASELLYNIVKMQQYKGLTHAI